MSRVSILIVEDDADWRYMLKSYIKGEHDLVTVEDYSSALQTIKQRRFDVVILDLRLEDRDDENFQGMELLTFLRSQEEGNQTTRVIIISAYGTEQLIRESFKSYTLFDYIPKQAFNRREYQKIVGQAMTPLKKGEGAKITR